MASSVQSEFKSAFNEWKKKNEMQAGGGIIDLINLDNDQAKMCIGQQKMSFVLNFPPSFPNCSEGELSVFSEEDRLQEWSSSLFDFCERNSDLQEILDRAVELYHSYEEKFSSGEKTKQINEEELDEELLEYALYDEEKTRQLPNNGLSYNILKLWKDDVGSKSASERLMKDLETVLKTNSEHFGYKAIPTNSDLYNWHIKLFNFDTETTLYQDMQKLNKTRGLDHILLEMKFPSDYPFSPPFVRVIRPIFLSGTGYVNIGGAICMEMLTRAGWLPCNDIESTLISIRSVIMNGGGRLNLDNNQDYSEDEAIRGFKQVVQIHGWHK